MIAYSKKTLAGLMVLTGAAWVNYTFDFVFPKFAQAIAALTTTVACIYVSRIAASVRPIKRN